MNKVSSCPYCGANVYYLKSKYGNKIPVNPYSLTERDIQDIEDNKRVKFRVGEHTSHYLTCKFSPLFKNTARHIVKIY